MLFLKPESIGHRSIFTVFHASLFIFKFITIKSRVDEVTQYVINYKFTFISKLFIMSKFCRPNLSWLIMLLEVFPLMEPQNTYDPFYINKYFSLMTQYSEHCSLSALISCSMVTYKVFGIVLCLEFFSPSFVVLKVHALGLKVQNLAFGTEISTSFSNLRKQICWRTLAELTSLKTSVTFSVRRELNFYISFRIDSFIK
jgi:hypothetical protein